MKKTIQIAISIILLIILFIWTDIEQLKNSLVNANYFYLFLAIIIITVDRIVMGLKWKILLKVKQINISLLKATKIYYIANFLGLFLPPTIGTDFVRAYYIPKNEGSVQDILASIIVERYLGFLGIFFAGLLGCIYFIEYIEYDSFNKLFIIALSLVIIGTSVFIVSFNIKLINWLKNIFRPLGKRNIFKKILPVLKKLMDSYAYYRNHKTFLIISMALTFLEIFLVILWSYVVAIALNVDVSFTYFIAFIPIILFLVRLPITIDGFGINEGSYIYFLSLVGVTEALSFGVGLINHIITIVAILPGGIFYATDKSIKGFSKKLELNNNVLSEE